jgi:ribosomal protein L11 methyltransferase
MSYLEVSIATNAASAEYDGERLSELGALSVSFEVDETDTLRELAPEELDFKTVTGLKALFPAECDISLLKESLAKKHLPLLAISHLADQDWTQNWKSHFQKIQLGPNFWIIPSWEEISETENDIYLKLDPGLAFGTGAHPSTRLCLDYLASHSLTNKTVLDFGCGSGILAIAAALLGATHVTAVDHDPQALSATIENAHNNQVDQSRLDILLPENLKLEPVDLLLANILAQPLVSLAPTLSALIKPQGSLVLAGLLSKQADMIINAYANTIRFSDPIEQDGWIRLEGVKI